MYCGLRAALKHCLPLWRKGHTRTAFTLIEVLVVIAIVLVLIGIALPVLSGVRDQANRTLSLAKLHNLGVRFDAYYADFRGVFPYSDEETSHPIGVGTDQIGAGHFQYDINWPLMFPDMLALASSEAAPYLAPKALRPENASILRPDGNGLWLTSSYWYGLSFVADPKVWLPETTPSPALLRAVRVDEAAFPARKVLLWDHITPYLRAPARGFSPDRTDAVPMLFVDGRAAQMKPSESVPGFKGLRASDLGVFGNLGLGTRIQNTPGGVRGFDY